MKAQEILLAGKKTQSEFPIRRYGLVIAKGHTHHTAMQEV